MTNAVQFVRIGGPEVLEMTTRDVGSPGEGEIAINHTAIGLNFIDTYHRTGLYPLPLPAIPGLEAAGVVTAVGPGVTKFKEGDRVAYGAGPPGAYTQARIIPAGKVVKIPSGLSDEVAAAIMLKGMTAQYLIRQIYPVKKGETVLYHAIAGGVGLIACQWLKALGATVIGTVGSPEKAELAKSHGCDHTILYRDEDIAKTVRNLTDGVGVPVVFDSVGKDTFIASLDSLQPKGLLVSYGNASGPVKDVDLGMLAAKGSLFVTRPTLAHYATDPATMQSMADELFGMVKSGKIKVEINQRYALADVQQAHRDLEGRKTTGQTVIIP